MELRAIAFNHDPTSSRRSAINLRRNADEFVTVPEWQAGQIEPSHVAFSIASTFGEVITIRASLSSREHAGRSAEVRARPTPAPFHLINPWSETWPLTATGTPSAVAIWDHHAGALGGVQARSVNFDTEGQSGLVQFELPAPGASTVPASACTTSRGHGSLATRSDGPGSRSRSRTNGCTRFSTYRARHGSSFHTTVAIPSCHGPMSSIWPACGRRAHAIRSRHRRR